MSNLKFSIARGIVASMMKVKSVSFFSGVATLLVAINLLGFTGISHQKRYHNLPSMTSSHIPSPPHTIVPSNAPLVDLAYIHLPRGKHPHMGATSPRNSRDIGQYVPNVTHLRGNPPSSLFSAADWKRECNIRDRDYEALKRIQIAKPHRNGTRLFCGIYSIEKNRKHYQAIRETWGLKCDGFMVASDRTNPAFDAVNVVHAGPEEYKNMYQKVRSIWAYIYDNYYDDFDWFHLGGDDMFVVVENLKAYVESEEIVHAQSGGFSLNDGTGAMDQQVPLFLGGSIAYAGDETKVYQTGGPGYTLNRAALKKLVMDGLPRTPNSKRVSYEDIVISRLFREMNITAYRTTDQDNGVRYNHYGPGDHYFALEPNFYPIWTKALAYNRGRNFSSVHSVSFHYVSARNMRRFYALVYGLCSQLTE